MKKVMLAILDGFGINEITEANAVKLARTPNLNGLMNYPNTSINASELYVGLPEGQMGNSEVGHMNIGSGRVIYQDYVKINKDIESGEFFNKKEFIEAINRAKNNNKKLHLLGLVSDGGVHSHINHLIALLELCNKMDFRNVYIHAFMDGRDTPTNSGITYLNKLNDEINRLNVGKIATISGRYYAMDRDKRWDRIELAYKTLVYGEGEKFESHIDAMYDTYNKNVTDEFIVPCVIDSNGLIEENDSVIFFNFRTDRPREITRALVDNDFNEFTTKKLDLYYVCMTLYDKTIPNVEVVYKPEIITNTIGEYVASKGLKQLRIAETEKYAHVTFFFNGGREIEFDNEDRILIPSPKVATYDLKPEMSSYEITEGVVEAINKDIYDMIILNFACTDMVGHTGVLDSAIKAVEAVDECLGKIIDAIDEHDYAFILTADHGNCETMINYETREVHTAHTTNLVPFIVYGLGTNFNLRNGGALEDVAPTMLDIMGLDKPKEMTGNSLIERN